MVISESAMDRPGERLEEISAKDKLIQSALTLFKEKGVANVSVQDICDHAQVSRSLFYYYFDSKESVFEGYRWIAKSKIIEKMDEIISKPTYCEQYLALALAYADSNISLGSELMGRFYMYNISHNTGFEADDSQIFYLSLCESTIQKAQQAGEMLNLSPPKLLAKTYLYSTFGLNLNWITSGGKFNPKQGYKEMFNAIFLPTHPFDNDDE